MASTYESHLKFFAKLYTAVTVCVALFGLGIIGYQCFSWLHDGYWTELPLRKFISQSLSLHWGSARGLENIWTSLLNIPTGLTVLVIGICGLPWAIKMFVEADQRQAVQIQGWPEREGPKPIPLVLIPSEGVSASFESFPRRGNRPSPRPTPSLGSTQEALGREKWGKGSRRGEGTRSSVYENKDSLAPAFVEQIGSKYERAGLGRQELEAGLRDDTLGALWQRSWIDRDRVGKALELKRIVVAIDRAVSLGEDADKPGIAVAGIDGAGHGYVATSAHSSGP